MACWVTFYFLFKVVTAQILQLITSVSKTDALDVYRAIFRPGSLRYSNYQENHVDKHNLVHADTYESEKIKEGGCSCNV